MLDYEAYLRRIGLDPAARPDWQAIHRAHVTAIPFENLDSHRGIPVSLEQSDLEHKLVQCGRGGYCFEQNLLLRSALQHLGLEVEPMLARVRLGAASPEARAATHLVLRVTDGAGRRWHADVGFGSGGLFDPIPFGPDGEHEQHGWRFRVVADGDELVLQAAGTQEWADLYGFRPEPSPRIDLEVSNWWVCTHPTSPFVSGLIASTSHPDGTRDVLSDWAGPLRRFEVSPGATTTTEEPRDRIPALLAERFGLPGFALGPDGRVVAQQ